MLYPSISCEICGKEEMCLSEHNLCESCEFHYFGGRVDIDSSFCSGWGEDDDDWEWSV